MKNLTTLLFLFFSLALSYAQDFAADHILIKTRNKTSLQALNNTNKELAQIFLSIKSLFKKKNIYLLQLTDGVHLGSTIEKLKKDPNILHASKDYKTQTRDTPNDEFFSQQDGLSIIKAPEFWDKTTGGTNVNGEDIVVAIIDDGYDQIHEDLIENLWNNPGEIDGDNIDNDNNGYIDDIVGINITSETDDHIKHSHGTSVAGIIGAKGDNGKGISGINWNVKLMLISTSGLVSDIVLAYQYVEDQRSRYNQSNGTEGAFIVASNSSFGIEDVMASDFPIWCSLYDDMGEVGVLSTVSTSNSSKNVDETGDMPSTCSSPYIISVTNTNAADVIQGAHGLESIDIAAPGDETWSCKLNNDYASFGGTSAAAPMVAGGIALIYSLDLDIFTTNDTPSNTALNIKNAILNSARKVTGLDGSISTGGVLDLQKACDEISAGATPVNTLSFDVFPNPTSSFLRFKYGAPLNEAYEIIVYNNMGQVVYLDKKITDGTSENIVDLEIVDWAAGYYYVTLKTSEEKISKTFFKRN